MPRVAWLGAGARSSDPIDGETPLSHRMIVWNEKADRYVLTVNRWEEVALWGLLAIASIVPLVMAEFLFRPRDIEPRICCAVIFAPFGVLSARTAILRARERGWIEVSLRGEGTRWGSPGSEPMPDFVRVKMFAVLELPLGDATIAAILPSEAHVRVMGRWRYRHSGRVRAAVRQLNDLLAPPSPPQPPTSPAPPIAGTPPPSEDPPAPAAGPAPPPPAA